MMALRGSGDSMTPLWFMIVAVVLDSGLNPVFIRGLGPGAEARHRRLGDRDADRQLHGADRRSSIYIYVEGPAAAPARAASCAT